MIAEEEDKRFWFNRQRTSFSTNVPGLAPAVEPVSLALPLIGGDARFAPIVRTLSAMRVYSVNPASLKEMHEPDGGEVLRSDGSNAASVLLEIEGRSPEELARIHELLAAIVPAVRSVRALQHGNKFSLILRQEWGEGKRLKSEAFNISDGTLRALGLVLAVYQKSTPSVLVIEEPEATIHPSALGVVLDVLRNATRKMQVIVTTHSPDVLDAKWIQDSNLRVVSWRDGATTIGNISNSSREALRRHLMLAGELLRSNALDAAVLPQGITTPPSSLFQELT